MYEIKIFYNPNPADFPSSCLLFLLKSSQIQFRLSLGD